MDLILEVTKTLSALVENEVEKRRQQQRLIAAASQKRTTRFGFDPVHYVSSDNIDAALCNAVEDSESSDGYFTAFRGQSMIHGPVVIKLPLPEAPSFVDEMFAHELLVGSMNCERLLKPVAVCIDRRALMFPYIRTLSELLVAETVQLECSAWIRILLHVAEGLEFLHGQKLVHRNVKAHAIVIDFSGDAFVTGTGFVTRCDIPQENVIVTGGYSDPLLIKSATHDSSFDVYSMGIVIAQVMLRRSSLFGAASDPEGSVDWLANVLSRSTDAQRFLAGYSSSGAPSWPNDVANTLFGLVMECVEWNIYERPRPSMATVAARLRDLAQ